MLKQSFCLRTVPELRARVTGWRAAGARVALVPTMGALHAGHLSLVDRAREAADRVIVSIFVNPAQFAPSEDLDAYPRSFAEDCALLDHKGVDLVYGPAAETMYPHGFATGIDVGGTALAGLEDRFRPHFFRGVATVVAKLLIQSACDVAVFGEKDFQQLRVVERLVADLDLPVQILAAPTVRDPDGLALSSRNRTLSPEARQRAAVLPRVLASVVAALQAGSPRAEVLARGIAAIAAAGFDVDYLELRDAATLAPSGAEAGPQRLLAAVRLGDVRLIDNVPV